MNPFRKSREFSLFRQMVFGDRAGAPDQHNPLHPLMTSGSGNAARHLAEAVADVDAASASELEND